jgi:transcriptional regulator with XRE-family HTH domain
MPTSATDRATVPAALEVIAACRAARRLRRLPLRAVATAAGTSLSTVVRIERGRVPCLDTLTRYAAACGLPVTFGVAAAADPEPAADEDDLGGDLDALAADVAAKLDAAERQCEGLRRVMAAVEGWRADVAKLDAAGGP